MRGSGPWNRSWLYSVPRGQGRLLGTYEGLMQNRSFRGNSTGRTQPLLFDDQVPPLSPPGKTTVRYPHAPATPGGDTYACVLSTDTMPDIRCSNLPLPFALCPVLTNILFNIYLTTRTFRLIRSRRAYHLLSHLNFSPSFSPSTVKLYHLFILPMDKTFCFRTHTTLDMYPFCISRCCRIETVTICIVFTASFDQMFCALPHEFETTTATAAFYVPRTHSRTASLSQRTVVGVR